MLLWLGLVSALEAAVPPCVLLWCLLSLVSAIAAVRWSCKTCGLLAACRSKGALPVHHVPPYIFRDWASVRSVAWTIVAIASWMVVHAELNSLCGYFCPVLQQEQMYVFKVSEQVWTRHLSGTGLTVKCHKTFEIYCAGSPQLSLTLSAHVQLGAFWRAVESFP